MVKVCHVNTYFSGGAGKAAYRLHRNLLIDGIHSDFICTDENSPDLRVYQVEQIKHSYADRFLNKIGFPQLNFHKNQKRKKKIIGNYEKISFPENDYKLHENEYIKNCDVIHLHWVSDFLDYATFFDNIQNKPIVWTLHDMAAFLGVFHYKNDIKRNAKFAEFDQKIINNKISYLEKNKNVVIVSPSEWLQKQSVKSALLGRFKHYHIPNGLEAKEFKKYDKEYAMRKLGCIKHKPCFIFVADHLDNHRKGFDLLYKALEKIPPFSVQLITLGSGKPSFKNQHHIHLGFVKNLTTLSLAYSAADLCIIPSLEDNLPNVMIESFSVGTPVLSFKIGGMSDWIDNETNGFFADNVNSESLQLALSDFINGKYKFHPEKIKKLFEKEFSSKIQSERYQKLYESLLRQ